MILMMPLVQNTLSRFVAGGQIAGCSARIMRHDEVLFEGHFGYADIEEKDYNAGNSFKCKVNLEVCAAPKLT